MPAHFIIRRLLPLALLWPALPASGQSELRLDAKRIEDALTGMVASGRAAGASVLIWKDRREAYFGTAGFADREARRPMTRDTIAQIYSMTKPVTGVALMQLWEQGKFGLDEPLSRYLPEFESMQVYTGKDAAGTHSSMMTIAVISLLVPAIFVRSVPHLHEADLRVQNLSLRAVEVGGRGLLCTESVAVASPYARLVPPRFVTDRRQSPSVTRPIWSAYTAASVRSRTFSLLRMSLT